MRLKLVAAAICLIAISIVVTPILWQWSYRERLTRAVQIGSTRDDYLKALIGGHLGPGMIRPGYTFWRPFNAHGCVYTIVAYPEWDSTKHLLGYDLCPELSLRGHHYYFARPKEKIQDLL